jgi:Transmembrane family 220, helix
MSLFAKILAWFWFVVFLLFAIVQYNDPDPLVWIAVYLLFACLDLLSVYFKIPWWGFAAVIAVSLIWAFFQWPETWEGIGEKMLNKNMEEAREALGLIVCATSAAIMWWVSHKIRNESEQ